MGRWRIPEYVVDAIQWFPGVEIEGVGPCPRSACNHPDVPEHASVEVDGRPVKVSPGCWVIRNVAGRRSVMNDKQFHELFEPLVSSEDVSK